MNRRKRMKIIMDMRSDGLEDEARHLIKKIRKQERESDRYNPLPRGIAYNTTLYPQSCDECGEMFWTRDPYSSHRGCKGYVKGTGF